MQTTTYQLLENGLTQMGFFGGGHTDDMDLAAGLSVMVEGSHLPDDYEAGEFHLLSLGVYVGLANMHVVFFSGCLCHSGTPPLAPSGEIETWAYHFVLILNPASRMMTMCRAASYMVTVEAWTSLQCMLVCNWSQESLRFITVNMHRVHICLQVKLCANANVAGVKYECR